MFVSKEGNMEAKKGKRHFKKRDESLQKMKKKKIALNFPRTWQVICEESFILIIK